jgi:hypothetical protein
MPEHVVVVREVGREAMGDRQQALALRRQIGPRRIGAAHDGCEAIERRILDAVSLDDRIERAAVTVFGSYAAH